MKNRRFFEGFSFVELLVAISIMALVFSVGHANFRDFQRRQYLESAVRKVEADLRLAQEMAIAGRKSDSCTSDLLGYTFQLNESDDSYSITPSCTGGAQVKSENLPEGVDIQSNVAGDNFRFNILGQGIDEASDVGIVLSFSGAGIDDMGIIVTPVGEIKRGDVALAPAFEPCSGGSWNSCDGYCDFMGKTCVSNGCFDASCTNSGCSMYWFGMSLGCYNCGVGFSNMCNMNPPLEVYCCCQ